jgi:hypothetical protein
MRRTEHFALRDHDGRWTTAALAAARRCLLSAAYCPAVVTTTFNLAKVSHVRRLNRQALRRALLDLGLVTIKRRTITTPFKLQKAVMIL